MKKILLLAVASLVAFDRVGAHEHVEVGVDPHDSLRLGLSGPSSQTAVFVPRGEPWSGYLLDFPGGWHAVELTFTTESGALAIAEGADPYVELISVEGPPGGQFAFWEVGATSPTWARSSGWSASPEDTPSFPVVYFGEPHTHGRAFTMDLPGQYSVSFRVVDWNARFSESREYTISFQAQQPPALKIAISGDSIVLSFTSRHGFAYDLQQCLDLSSNAWETIDFRAGNGGLQSLGFSRSGLGRGFYRLVEF